MAKQPSRDDPSKPKAHGYAYKKQFYQSADVAADYDEHRFRTPKRQRRNARKWNAIQKALALTDGVKSIVDLPCGTGPLHRQSRARGLRSGRQRHLGRDDAAGGQTAGRATRQHRGLCARRRRSAAVRTKSADCLMSIRFLFHVDGETRRRMLREFGRVSRRWIIADYRHKYSFRYGVWKISSTLGLTKRPFERVSVKSMKSEFEDAGLRVREDHRRCVAGCPTSGWCSRKRVTSIRRASRSSSRARSTPTSRSPRNSARANDPWSIARAGGAATVGLKVYKPAAIANHARKHKLPLAEFEHRRNRAFFEARGMAKYVAEPLGFVVEPGFQMSLQECLDGEVYYFAQRDHADFISPRFMEDLAELVIAEPRGEALRHRPARHERHGRSQGRHAEAVRLQPDPVHRAAAESRSSGSRSSSGC